LTVIVKEWYRYPFIYDVVAVTRKGLAPDAAVARREEITPTLLEALRRIALEPRWDDNDCLWFYGIHLLAQFREPAAYGPLLAICRLPEKQVQELLGDMVTESLPRLLRSVCCGNTDPLIQLLEDETVWPWAKVAAIRVLQAEAEPGSALEADLRHRYRGLLEKAIQAARAAQADETMEYDDITPTYIGLSCVEMYFHDMLPLLKTAFDEGAFDTMVMSWEEYERELAPGLPAKVVQQNRTRHRAKVIDNAAVEIRKWGCF
jgi:hypothetical protein